jgi:hypothetical protein
LTELRPRVQYSMRLVVSARELPADWTTCRLFRVHVQSASGPRTPPREEITAMPFKLLPAQDYREHDRLNISGTAT